MSMHTPESKLNRRDRLILRHLVAVLTFLHLSNAGAQVQACAEAFKAATRVRPALEKVRFEETTTHWVTPLHFGEYEMLAAPPRGSLNRKVIGYFPKEDPDNMMRMQQIHDPVSVELMPLVQPDQSSYFAVSSLDQNSGRTHIKLFDIHRTEVLKNIINVPLELTWTTYAEKGTVGQKDIESFKATEDALPPQRKVIFVTSKNEIATDGKPSTRMLAVMRFFDGSPFPALYVGKNAANSQVAARALGDRRLPIERRYTELNFRQTSNDIFEAGRLAADPSLDGVLKIQLYNMGAYLKSKYGFDEALPPGFARNGRVYAEITGQHLKTYMESVEKGGLGFTLVAASLSNSPQSGMHAITETKTFADYRAHRADPNARFVLYKSVEDVIQDFYQKSLTDGAKRIVPAFEPNQNKTVFESPFDAKYHRPMPKDFQF
jgi:hypothetical protein